ncbi:putative membrane protein [Tenacibaculum sp. MAR_2009_124]|uniref:DUF1304 domain-containing protein n=1 Tax=Tenacibaculum sp. MAR_2009_124 TaxID=1250059 RepID=UPI0008993BEC|nr:DUF1304 domain-containing protein [Tenacibaculum sp. MAR_2009_124]SEC56012.1 putative membrane protein [Tenacibaculum sp. MAR_2009_124]
MNLLQNFFIGILALIHIYILVLEMFLWTTPKGRKAFGIRDEQFAKDTKTLAANQGLYNGFLAAGFIWSMISQKVDIAIFFTLCVFIAGLYGSYSTGKKKILYIQSLPALITFILLLLKMS